MLFYQNNEVRFQLQSNHSFVSDDDSGYDVLMRQLEEYAGTSQSIWFIITCKVSGTYIFIPCNTWQSHIHALEYARVTSNVLPRISNVSTDINAFQALFYVMSMVQEAEQISSFMNIFVCTYSWQ